MHQDSDTDWRFGVFGLIPSLSAMKLHMPNSATVTACHDLDAYRIDAVPLTVSNLFCDRF